MSLLKNKIDVFVLTSFSTLYKDLFDEISNQKNFNQLTILTDNENSKLKNTKTVFVKSLFSTDTFSKISELAESEFSILIFAFNKINLNYNCFDKFLQAAKETNSSLLYSDFNDAVSGKQFPHMLIDYQEGSVRDDFDFGSIIMIRTQLLKNIFKNYNEDYLYAGWYSIRLNLTLQGSVLRINEFLYSIELISETSSEEKQFNYVDPKNREVQIEMEKAFTSYLVKTGAAVHPPFKAIDFNNEQEFEYEASVIIPVRNRVKTISDAISSALLQKTNFNFNIIVVDNLSTDGTTENIKTLMQSDSRIIHLIPERMDLGIGGCWNEAVNNNKCGRFAIQLDSDDLYKDEVTLQKIVDMFYDQKCAMVIGSYEIVDFNLNLLPPGLIDHKEWTNENGPNNALRINGLGAPRAFYTPVIRQIGFPNVSYGEDYAVALAISREFKVGRIYDSIYLCRRWEGNSDSNISLAKQNEYNFFKDRIRTEEIYLRRKKSKRIN